MSWQRMRAVTSFDDFWKQCTTDEQAIIDNLRNLILECGNLQEKISYGVPYYSANRRVFFLWPASAAFGPKEGVLLGFCEGHKLTDRDQILEKGKRKQVYWVTIRQMADIDHRRLRPLILEALEIDHLYASLARRLPSVRKPG